MILITVWDGLRPDMISEGHTPFLHAMSQRGVVCRASHAAFPTATRINSASLATGCYPGKHGIVDNELYVPRLDPDKAISCADWRALQSMADGEQERLISVPTLGEMLRQAGATMVSAGSGSPGTTYLTNPTITGSVVNWALAWPDGTQRDVETRFGGMLPPESSSSERNRFIFDVAREYLAPTYRPDVMTIWLTEPDHMQHEYGLASPEALAMMREVDAQFAEFVQTMERRAGPDGLTCLVLSDHGFSTISTKIDPEAELAAAGFSSASNAGDGPIDIVRASNSLYVRDEGRARLPELLRFLASRPWIGALLVRDDLMHVCPTATPQGAAFGFHRRSAEVMFSYAWSAAPNRWGVPGSVANSASMAATHGSSSPYAINNTLVAWGAGIKSGVESRTPCGIVDVAPTVLHLLGIGVGQGMDGRVLHELFQTGPEPEQMRVRHTQREDTFPAEEGPCRQLLQYSQVGGHLYLDEARFVEEP
ncbi:MAG: alkaline phosphatase family protein [Anaerolineae bacterium]|nr:alkaline phosphatase family protein [Anaerolineae bacterium]